MSYVLVTQIWLQVRLWIVEGSDNDKGIPQDSTTGAMTMKVNLLNCLMYVLEELLESLMRITLSQNEVDEDIIFDESDQEMQ